MSTDVYVYEIKIALEFQSGRWIGWSGRASSPREDFLFPMESSPDTPAHRLSDRDVTDFVRNSIHEIRSTEWYEARD